MVLARPGVRSTTKIDSKKQFISSQAFHRTPGGRVQKTTAGEQFRPRILNSFDPAAQEHYRNSTCNHPHTQQAKIRGLTNEAEMKHLAGAGLHRGKSSASKMSADREADFGQR
jgi:hypothetical protein